MTASRRPAAAGNIRSDESNKGSSGAPGQPGALFCGFAESQPSLHCSERVRDPQSARGVWQAAPVSGNHRVTDPAGAKEERKAGEPG